MGFIEAVSVRHYRSSYDVREIDLDTDLTVIVGPNGAGKSNFLRGIASFDPSKRVENADLSVHDQSLSESSPSDIPITSLKLDIWSKNELPLRVLHRQPPLKSVEIQNGSILTAEGEFQELEDALPANEDTIKITAYANGSYRIQTSSGRYNLETVAKKRQSDLQTASHEVIKQSALDHVVDRVPVASEINSTALAEIISVVDEAIHSDDSESTLPDENDMEGDPTLPEPEEIYDDLNVLSEFLRDAELLLSSPNKALPKIAYFDQIPTASDNVALTKLGEDETYRAFVRWGGLDPGRVDSVSQQRRESGLERAAEELTRYLNSYINLEGPVQAQVTEAVTDPLRGRFSVSSEVESDHVVIKIRDKQEDTNIQLSEKSTGFRWLVGCITMLFGGTAESKQKDLFVIDDIGINLHPDWKIKLRHAIHELTTDSQIMYSTHSPFLINNNNLDQIRIVSNDTNESLGSLVTTVAETRGSKYVHDILEPIRASLGARVSEFLFGGSGIVVVEGESDKDYIEHFADIFESDPSYPTLDEQIEFMIAKGSNQPVLANFLEVEESNYVVLTDKDQSGDVQKKKMLENGINEKKIIQLDSLPEQPDSHETEIEDLFPTELVCEGVARQYPSQVTLRALERRVNSSTGGGVLANIKGRLDQYEAEGDISGRDEISKEDLKDYILRHVDGSWLEKDNPEKQTVDDFKWLIQTLNSRLA